MGGCSVIGQGSEHETRDHTEALVWYGEFRSEQEAKLATKLLLKEDRVTGKEHVKDLNGHVNGDRIVAARKQEEKAFMVIRKHGFNYWIIESLLSKEEQKKVHQIRVQGKVAILVNADGDVVNARVMSARGIQVSSAEAIDLLLAQARSMKFKPRPGCGTDRYAMSFTLQGN